ncbi:MAG: Unknown protein [uncultured Aureispira sp.]|uniref:Glyoxalase n=1 Tax=uncultured Aureispira sp. TaxID=1331704 RepID=A0A6S6SYT0_9BACT|nr:MAG: Unknown protein [uncultured Aureispira sp.]
MHLNRTEIRPLIKGIDMGLNKSLEEDFQNKTLRPIIKMQHDLLVAYFKDYLISKKCKFEPLSNSKKQDYISTLFKKDHAFKLELRGLIVGHFTTDEFAVYCQRKSDFNKRIVGMIQERISSVLDVI